MKNFLESNQKQEIRVRISEDIVLYEPNEEQMEDLRNILKENLKVDGNLNATGEISYKYIRWIIRNLCMNGAFIDEYSDDELEKLIENGNKYIKKLINEIMDLLSEIGEDLLVEHSNLIDTYSKMGTILNSNIDMENMKTKFDKLLKKNGYNNIKFEDVLNGNVDLEKLEKNKTKSKKQRKK